MIGWILVLIRRFIPSNPNKYIVISQNSISKNTLKLFFVCELCSVEKQRIRKNSPNQVLFLYRQGLE